MNLENFTPFNPSLFVTAHDVRPRTCTVLVKATFMCQHGAEAAPVEEQLQPSGDVLSEGEDGAPKSLLYASDITPGKSRAEVLVSGTAYPPANHASSSFPISIRVGSVAKTLVVSAERTFSHGLVSSSITEQGPLKPVPVVYQNAFGGPRWATNPVGRGHESDRLPLIEYPDQRMQRPSDTPAPAGFGPIAPDWEPRKSMLGTFRADYAEKHWPGFPPDFNPRYFNAAPVDQQVDGYLRGDETIELQNMHPKHSSFTTRLPGWQVVCVREEMDGTVSLVPLEIDTLWLSPDTDQLVLLWRGSMPALTPDLLEVKRLGFLLRRLDQPLRKADEYSKRIDELIAEEEGPFQPEAPPAAPATESANEEATASEPAEDEEQVAYAKTMAQAESIRAEAGQNQAPPKPTEAPPASPESQALMARWEAEEKQQAEEEAAARWTREKVLAAVAAKQPLAGADLSGLDLGRTDWRDVDFRGAKLQSVNFARATFTRCQFTGCNVSEANLDATSFEHSVLDRANFQHSRLQKTIWKQTTAVGTDFTEANFDDALLTGAKLAGALFQAASMVAARFAQCELSGAVLSNAKAPKASFQEAKLDEAICDHADFSNAQFGKASLNTTIFTGSQLAHANFDAAQLPDADFSEADLTDASFRGALCDGAWLSSARADRVNFHGSSCVDLQLDGTQAKKADFSKSRIHSLRGSKQTDLSGANFSQSRGRAPIFETCCLADANFRNAQLVGVSFVHASLVRADLTAADLKGARLDHANCENAIFEAANLFESNLTGVNLTGADIRGANLYGSELMDARIDKIRHQNANLQMTKLESWASSQASR